ncbi:MAG TPA: HEAT repeat domain-containing protein [Bacteroidota bacterium]|nr:HEAT repeat domain-containing protein [Bacteroidota bacterium]
MKKREKEKESGMPDTSPLSDSVMDEHVAALRSHDASERMHARIRLERMGRTAAPILISLLNDRNEYVRWEACKALVKLEDPASAEALVLALDDNSMAVQWLAAEALIALKLEAVPPLLRLLERKFDSIFVRQGAHHILHALERENLLNKETIAVIDSLRSIGPGVATALAAEHALMSIRRASRQKNFSEHDA